MLFSNQGLSTSKTRNIPKRNNNIDSNNIGFIKLLDSIMSRGNLLFFGLKVAAFVVVFWIHFKARAFVPTTTSFSYPSRTLRRIDFQRLPSASSLFGSGRGMGNGTISSAAGKKKKGGGKNKNKGSQSITSSSASSSSPFDVSSSLLRLEKKYDELLLQAAKELQKEEDDDDKTWMISEYVVAARSSKKQGSIPDWVPIAQLCLKRPESEYKDGASDVMVQTAISAYCRELSHVATIGAPVFSTIPRNELQYSVESIDCFHKFVYDEVVEGKANQHPEQIMTKAEARKTLGLLDEDNAQKLDDMNATNSANGGTFEISKANIKQAYRKLSFELHPDRFEGTPEECEEATRQFGRVKLAYETLTSGVRGEEGISWYESLGGRARTGFVGPINLLPLSAAQEHLKRHNAEGALVGLEPSMVQSFVARHLRSA